MTSFNEFATSYLSQSGALSDEGIEEEDGQLPFSSSLFESQPAPQKQAKQEYPSSTLWDKPSLLQRGWKAYESVLPGSSKGKGAAHKPLLVTHHSDQSDDEEELEEPPSFLEQPPGGLSAPLLGDRAAVYVYPSTGTEPESKRGKRYRDPGWIVLYGTAVLGALVMSIHAWWTSVPSDAPRTGHALLPALSVLPLVAFLAFLGGLFALVYLHLIQNAVSHLVLGSLLGAPVSLVATGLILFYGSFESSGIEASGAWKFGVRTASLVCMGAAWGMARYALAQKARVERTVAVLRLSAMILQAYPTLLLVGAATALASVILTLPFLSLLAYLLGGNYESLPRWISVPFVLLLWLWTLEALNAMQRLTAAGVLGEWWYHRNEEDRPTAQEVTRASLERATGPSAGTVLGFAFFLAWLQALGFTAKRMQKALKRNDLPQFFKAFEFLLPLLNAIMAAAERYSAYCLSFVGLTGESLWASVGKTGELIGGSRSHAIIENLLVNWTLRVSSLVIALLAGSIAFFLVSSRVTDASDVGLSPIIAVLCFAVPYWSVRLCAALLSDVADACYLCHLIDQATTPPGGLSNCEEADEAFSKHGGKGLPTSAY